ncbi:hypothetical protein [Streptomyces lichenis]|uniref:4Fe-4S ferredoxin-type domain-containing protein n=1 Tax=Streptomyces lichenis TaxID=2306967 RepID=A0ABT0I5L1_9ACTN|nr:hypothetical protein [Streptomyces lichenis]MCK8676572.1 hypothetical protein [Streptomyces lichenis]
MMTDVPVTRQLPVCQSCWREPATARRDSSDLCGECAAGGCPARVDLFPPLGIYGLPARKVPPLGPVRWGPLMDDGKHGKPGPPQLPPDPGPHPPPKPRPQSPPGTPPV